VSSAQNNESKPRTMQLSPAWKCGQPTNPISQAEALVKLNQVTQVMFGYDASSLSYYSYTTELEALMKGGTTTGCMASLATGTEFAQQVWQIAVGAAFDFCAQVLGIDQSPDAPALKQGMICNYFNPAVNSNVPAVNFGWMIPSLVQQQAWIDIDPNCDHVPTPLPTTAYPNPCSSPRTTP
jgi:hypothetical protein